MFDLGLQLGAGKSEKQHTGVRKALIEDQLAEIEVRYNQDPLLLPRELQNVLIRQAMRVIA
jgi:hypothetical protein